tara:strand:- start:412 stop:1626 length:1215 start_codon:yes stop_codon:yes gene_type:complete
MKIFSVVRGGKSMKAKIADINKFLDPVAARRKRSVGVIINMMMVVEALQATLNDFNESAAGFVFEGFMAALTGGKQIAGKVGGTLPIEDFVAFSDYGGGSSVPVSLKLLTLEGITKGSYTNLVDYLVVRGEPAIKYLIAFKFTPDDNVDQLQFWEFEINRSNFVTFISGAGVSRGLLHTPGRGSYAGPKELADAFQAYAMEDSKENQMRVAELVQRTAGYKRGLIPAFLEANGRTPEEVEMDMSPEELEDLEAKKQKKQAALLRKKEKGERDIAIAQADGYFAESFHQGEKRLLKEEMLNEAYGEASQWKATWPQIKNLGADINLNTYGAIDLSQSRIDELAEIYSEKLKGDVITLLTEAKNLADNIGSYYREKRRSKANAAANTALESTEKISNVLEKDPRYN